MENQGVEERPQPDPCLVFCPKLRDWESKALCS